AGAVAGTERLKQLLYLLIRFPIDLAELAPAQWRQVEQVLARVGLRWAASDEPALLEALEETADITGVEPEVGDEIGGRRPIADGNFVDDACFGQRERTAEQRLLQHAHPPGVKAREPADAGHGMVETGSGHSSNPMSDDRLRERVER